MIGEYLRKRSAEESANDPECLAELVGEEVIGFIPREGGYLIVFKSMSEFWFRNSTGAFSLVSSSKVRQEVQSRKRQLESNLAVFKSTQELLEKVKI